MADRRPDSGDSGRSKRQKTSSTDMDPKDNPYLAHMYEEDEEDEVEDNSYGYGYGHGKPAGRMNGRSTSSALANFPRHKTTTAMANRAEDGPNNPFNGKPLSAQYFNILRTRRNLPVHAQRYRNSEAFSIRFTDFFVEMNFWKCITSPKSWSSSERQAPARQLRSPSLYCLTIFLIFRGSWWHARNLAEWQPCL